MTIIRNTTSSSNNDGYSSGENVLNGVANLDSEGLLPNSILPVNAVTLQGIWDAETNVPELVDGVGEDGYLYIVTTSGSTSLDGTSNWLIGDSCMFVANQTKWIKLGSESTVSSVNGKTGTVTISAFIGATSAESGESGFVPMPTSGDRGKFLQGGGGWISLPENILFSEKGQIGGVATLDNSGIVPLSQLPADLTVEVSTIANLALLNSLNRKEGNITKVLDFDGYQNPRMYVYDGSSWLGFPVSESQSNGGESFALLGLELYPHITSATGTALMTKDIVSQIVIEGEHFAPNTVIEIYDDLEVVHSEHLSSTYHSPSKISATIRAPSFPGTYHLRCTNKTLSSDPSGDSLVNVMSGLDKCLEFDGVGEYLDGGNFDMGLSGATNVTIECELQWTQKPSSFVSSGQKWCNCFFAGDPSNPDSLFQVAIAHNKSNKKFEGKISDGRNDYVPTIGGYNNWSNSSQIGPQRHVKTILLNGVLDVEIDGDSKSAWTRSVSGGVQAWTSNMRFTVGRWPAIWNFYRAFPGKLRNILIKKDEVPLFNLPCDTITPLLVNASLRSAHPYHDWSGYNDGDTILAVVDLAQGALMILRNMDETNLVDWS